MPIPVFADESLQAFSLGTEAGRIGDITVDGITGSLVGDWTDSDIVVGYNFNMRVEFPKIYPVAKSGLSGTIQSDTRGSLVVSRINVTLGDSGYYEAKLTSLGRDDRTITFESITAGQYEANSVPILNESIRSIPIYDKNTNFTLELSSNHPSPTTLYSMEWEGNYTNKYYRSV